MNDILSKFNQVKSIGKNKWQARCPAHNDKTPSLSIKLDSDKWLLYCHAGCNTKEILKSVNLKESDLFMNNKHTNKTVKQCNTNNSDENIYDIDDDTSKALQHCNTSKNNNKSSLTAIDKGCSLLSYSEFKEIPEVFLKTKCFLNDTVLNKKNALLIPYRDEFNETVATRYRLSLDGSDFNKFIWKKGTTPFLYGIWKLKDFKQQNDFIIIVEGESDCHTLWYNDLPAIGVPGATLWKEDRDAVFFNVFKTIYLIKEPDAGGNKLLSSLSESSLKDRIKVVSLGEYKDPSELYINNPKNFKSKFQRCLDASLPLKDYQLEDVKRIIENSWKYCESIARQQKILNTFAGMLPDVKIAGEIKLCQLLYLSLTTRHFNSPVSITVKGHSGSGKSYTTNKVIKVFFPPEAVFIITGMSEKALIHSPENFKHRFIMVEERAGIPLGGNAEYFIRTLQSEGNLNYATVDMDSKEKNKGVTIKKEGPTGFILTTTDFKLNPENENRCVTVFTDESSEQTERVMTLRADKRPEPDTRDWIAFQTWLSFNVKTVIVPYTDCIIKETIKKAVRIRRDFDTLLSLIEVHALIHQLNRDVNDRGEIVAILEDYTVVYNLVNDLISYSIESSIPSKIRDVVRAVAEKTEQSDFKDGVSLTQIADMLNVHKSTVSRNLKEAENQGFLMNNQTKSGVSAKYVLAEPLPDDASVLPHPDVVQEYIKKNKIFPVPPIYSFDQYFFDYDKKLKDKRFSADNAYKHYMKIADNRKRSFDNNIEDFTIEYDSRYIYNDILLERELGVA